MPFLVYFITGIPIPGIFALRRNVQLKSRSLMPGAWYDIAGRQRKTQTIVIK